jgi:hypothetical protein
VRMLASFCVPLIDLSQDRRLDETRGAQGDVATIAAPQQSQILAACRQESVELRHKPEKA